MEPMAATVAAEDPEIAPKNAEAINAAIARPAKNRVEHIYQTLSYTALFKNCTGNDKKGNCHQAVGIRRYEKFLCNDHHRDICKAKQVDK